MLQPIPRLEDYDVSPHNGFLPDDDPLARLTDPVYAPWENVISNLQALILSRRVREVIRRLPTLPTDQLRTEPEWRRAYSILAFMVHAYVWGGDRPEEVIPPPLSIPFLATCKHLQLPPVATYAATVLWNYQVLFPTEELDLSNVSTLQTFTGSLDESWFFLVSVVVEGRGASIIPTMLRAIAAARTNDRATVVACLQSFAERLDELSSILVRMYEQNDPHVFYHRIRPFLAGSKNMGDAGLPRGVLFDDGTGASEFVQYSGGSNAQSSLIQFFDIVLGIEHRPTGTLKPSTSAPETSRAPPSGPPSHDFITQMRAYMPGRHAQFLRDVTTVANIREYVHENSSDRTLSTAYDACLAMLREFRDRHIQMVSRYIIVKSRESQKQTPLPIRESPKRMNLATATSANAKGEGRKNPRGTGGTALIPFLKQARDETSETSIGNWARRILTDKSGAGSVHLGGIDEHANGKVEIVGLAGTWSTDDSEGGICHW